MRRTHYIVLIVAGVAGYLLGTFGTTGAVAQRAGGNNPDAGSPRFQISAFAAQAQNGDAFHACYITDTSTGQLWLAIPGQGEAQKVSGAPRR